LHNKAQYLIANTVGV